MLAYNIIIYLIIYLTYNHIIMVPDKSQEALKLKYYEYDFYNLGRCALGEVMNLTQLKLLSNREVNKIVKQLF